MQAGALFRVIYTTQVRNIRSAVLAQYTTHYRRAHGGRRLASSPTVILVADPPRAASFQSGTQHASSVRSRQVRCSDLALLFDHIADSGSNAWSGRRPGPCRRLRSWQRRRCTIRVSAAEALDPDNASILVAGGGGIALDVTRRLKDMGAWAWMLQRSESRRWAARRGTLTCACNEERADGVLELAHLLSATQHLGLSKLRWFSRESDIGCSEPPLTEAQATLVSAGLGPL